MKILNVNLGVNSYDIIMQDGILHNIGTKIKKLNKDGKIAVITDENVFNLYGAAIENSLVRCDYKVHFIIIKPGEKSKSLEVLQEVYAHLINYGITRSDLIIAFGGGVVGDLAGFAASTYLRGVDYVQVPTSLLAQIDSSIGGKVAVNLEQGKNLVGSFYHPKMVIIDPKVLSTLSERYIKDGLGEVIKYACIKDLSFFNELGKIKSKEELFEKIEDIIYTCCNIKREIVENDERDTGMRMLLNFGHTMGHAIEKCSSYEYSHGEAVAIGMYYISKKSEALGYTETGTADKIKNLLVNFDISYDLPNLSMDNIKETVCLDKKNISGKINLILLKQIGVAYIESVPISNIDKFFEEHL